MCQKRFSQGKLAWWPKNTSNVVTLRTSELHILLVQGDPIKAAIPVDWRSVRQDYAAVAAGENRLSL